jgi:hypothetical protein
METEKSYLDNSASDQRGTKGKGARQRPTDAEEEESPAEKPE